MKKKDCRYEYFRHIHGFPAYSRVLIYKRMSKYEKEMVVELNTFTLKRYLFRERGTGLLDGKLATLA